MSTPVRGRYYLRCDSCQAYVWTSDRVQPENRDTVLTTFANVQCPRGGINCPHIDSSVAQRRAMRPYYLLQFLLSLQSLGDQLAPIAELAGTAHQQLHDADDALSARIDALESAEVRRPTMRLYTFTLAGLSLGASRDVVITWPTPMPTAVYDVAISENRVLMSALRNQTASGVTMTLQVNALITTVTITAGAVGWSV